jgi:acyl-CoA reductase-like NAD-dependent aldehyde dehydrogenase
VFVSKLTIGDPFDKKTKLGALISEQQFNKVMEYIEIGKKEGATLLEGSSDKFHLFCLIDDYCSKKSPYFAMNKFFSQI